MDIFGPFDHLSDADLREQLTRWCTHKIDPNIQKDEFDAYFHTVSPRSTFVKNAPPDACLLDMGAGEGSLSIYKVWPSVARSDLKFYGTSLDPIRLAANYEQVSISDFETTPRPFNGVEFDAVVASHFIEHLSDPSGFIGWAASCMKPGGRMYLEWPHEFSKRMPSSSFFAEHGIPAFTTNFFDDHTHLQTWTAQDIIDIAGTSGLQPEFAGRIVLPYAAGWMRDQAREASDKISGTFAIWCAVGWAQYVILTKTL
ncbi:2-polyprenyl-3-methyl-5-hydroxy-6-metoxy-1,4-benzoquinol methylase [Methylobacterium sp. BE186]|uniref:class I SAM-dependent methyltransferase n=1 Tax=Methylobacterium sp. BE186 TaxID=2817715 RepID=UPI002863C02E|nr:class I SAM-dependent methyltransferase [Methylobacterium sp. BE186]MDR7036505.1 2-polyprenyl-3-methyl-5-hydroxy-6-metoxy-1,4-benzoquinol methylase [Methylobacterium sp. BE186]